MEQQTRRCSNNTSSSRSNSCSRSISNNSNSSSRSNSCSRSINNNNSNSSSRSNSCSRSIHNNNSNSSSRSNSCNRSVNNNNNNSNNCSRSNSSSRSNSCSKSTNNINNSSTRSRSSNSSSSSSSNASANNVSNCKIDDQAVQADEAAAAAAKQLQVQQPVVLSSFHQLMLDSHNYYRAHHSAPPLKYCSTMTKRAQYWADVLAKENRMYHESQDWDGENIAMKWNSRHSNFPATDFVNMWYYEAENYYFPGTQLGQNTNGKCFVTGHFSQLVWKNSQRVGFGRAVAKTGRVFVVARYRPPGNYVNCFKANVLPPKDGKVAPRYRRQ